MSLILHCWCVYIAFILSLYIIDFIPLTCLRSEHPVVTSVTEATRPCRSIKCYKWSLSLSNNGGRRGRRALLRNNDECSLSLSLCTSAGGPPGTSDEEVMIFLWFHMMTPNKHKETPKKTQKQKDTTCTSPGGFWKLLANKEFGAFSWFQIITRNKHQTNTNK